MILIEKLGGPTVDDLKMEFVERKGLGHPDYIIDLACETVSRKLSKYYLNRFGQILHHNVDKGLLVGGKANPRFGGGIVEEPIEIIVAGRATSKVGDDFIPVVDIAREAVEDALRKNYRFLDVNKHVNIVIKLRPGSVDLTKLFQKGMNIPSANDTSFGVGFAPFSRAEKIALEIERYMNSKYYKNIFPFVGEDIKVMVLRNSNDFKVTIAAAFVDKFFSSSNEYISAKEEVLESIKEYLSGIELGGKINSIDLMLNTADDFKNGIYYITVTGLSAEAGDDGNTGRGNRVSGLITPNRHMSMEATAGKNPVSHVGKIYNVLAKKLSFRIYDEVEGIKEVYVKILSQIGSPITNPQAIHVQYSSKIAETSSLETQIRRIVEEEFSYDKLKQLSIDILEGKYTLF